MAQVTAVAEAIVPAAPARVLEALADYREARPAILTPAYTEYQVVEGGVGAGTVASWHLHATEKRVRDVVADVVVTSDSVVETDRNSSMVTTFTVATEDAATKVTVTTTWNGAGGVGGFFEKTFAPLGLRRIHGELLANLAAYVVS
ncbi:SRPBCC family protein [Nocardioides jiangxiensis]|uniref:SRPBCC family protein n=1 Tax=Nocardioides jiangxiensis TaxID=3064524 RepID=A0ABT9B768_9ACTN|nr:SRPBCC family protein [Nocardioides sp. WY-20]MDO7869146.1 SRPBCC family protein [Nocardioides sp. WY-20]